MRELPVGTINLGRMGCAALSRLQFHTLEPVLPQSMVMTTPANDDAVRG